MSGARGGDLAVTALYTAGTWAWAGIEGAELLDHADSRRVFGATNAALAVARALTPGLRSLRHSLVHRHTMIDHLLRASGARQVVELAAGLSPRGARFTRDPTLRYVEVDLPHVIARKIALLERTPAGREVRARPNLHLVAGDVLEVALDPLVEPGEPVFVIAEGLFMYLQPDAQRVLLRRARALAARAGRGTLVFDRVPPREEPPPGAVGRALEGMMKRFTRGQTFAKDERTRDELAAEVSAAGFAAVEMIEPAAVAAAWGLPFAEVPTQQLLFVGRG
jgi:O-methyltransferase involved in polyketide biosynthesis